MFLAPPQTVGGFLAEMFSGQRQNWSLNKANAIPIKRNVVEFRSHNSQAGILAYKPLTS